jgi:ribosomal protein L32
MGEDRCPSCGRSRIREESCFSCGRVFKDEVLLSFSKGQYIGTRRWKFQDANGKEHEVPALVWKDRILHFGEDGLYLMEEVKL